MQCSISQSCRVDSLNIKQSRTRTRLQYTYYSHEWVGIGKGGIMLFFNVSIVSIKNVTLHTTKSRQSRSCTDACSTVRIGPLSCTTPGLHSTCSPSLQIEIHTTEKSVWIHCQQRIKFPQISPYLGTRKSSCSAPWLCSATDEPH